MTQRTTGILSVSALICSAVAMSVGLFERFAQSESADNGQLERIEELERELAYLQGGSYRTRGNEYGKTALEEGGGEAEVDTASGRSSYLESDVEAMRWTMAVRGFMPATADQVDRAKRSIFSEYLSANERLDALRVLRRAEELDDDVVRASISTFHDSDDYRVQEDILELLDGVTTPELAPTLLKVTAEHLHYRVRRQAVDAMSGFLPDPELEDWLRLVEKNDGSRRVREEARRTLRQLEERRANQ